MPSASFGDQLHRPPQSTFEHQVGISTSLEPIGCRGAPAFHAKVDLLHGLPDQDRVEVSRLDQDLGGCLGGLGETSPHDARQGHRTLGIGDHQRRLREWLSTGLSARTHDRAAQKLQCLALGHAPDDDPGARDLLEVEGMKRLAPLVKDIVGDVDDIVDRSHSGQEQPRL